MGFRRGNISINADLSRSKMMMHNQRRILAMCLTQVLCLIHVIISGVIEPDLTGTNIETDGK